MMDKHEADEIMLSASRQTLPNGCAIYLKADVQALVDALAMAVQHGRIDDSETRMNLAFAALAKFKESGNG
jgi:hypothetical protein